MLGNVEFGYLRFHLVMLEIIGLFCYTSIRFRTVGLP